jgi:hypothetical protein
VQARFTAVAQAVSWRGLHQWGWRNQGPSLREG